MGCCLGRCPTITLRSICLGGMACGGTQGAVRKASELQDRTKEVPVGNVVTVELMSVEGVIESPEEWASPTPTRRWRRRTQRGYPSTGPPSGRHADGRLHKQRAQVRRLGDPGGAS